jgi:hypothetical protein
MSLLVSFPLPEDLREKLLLIFEGDENKQAMIREGSNLRLGAVLMEHHHQIDRPLSREMGSKLLELHPKSEEAARAREVLERPDRLYRLIGDWFAFIEGGPPLPAEFVDQAQACFPDAEDLRQLIEGRHYHDINMTLISSLDLIGGRSVMRWNPGETVLGLPHSTSYDDRGAAAKRLKGLIDFYWAGIYMSYLIALEDLPLAVEYGYVIRAETV